MHTPRDAFKTMTQGRQAYTATTNGKTQLNLTGLPALQSAYMKLGKHDVAAATAVLKAAVKGFWVEMPLEWGSNQRTTPLPPVKSPRTIALNTADKKET